MLWCFWETIRFWFRFNCSIQCNFPQIEHVHQARLMTVLTMHDEVKTNFQYIFTYSDCVLFTYYFPFYKEGNSEYFRFPKTSLANVNWKEIWAMTYTHILNCLVIWNATNEAYSFFLLLTFLKIYAVWKFCVRFEWEINIDLHLMYVCDQVSGWCQ